MATTAFEWSLTFDDVLLAPCYSDVVPKAASVRTRLCRGIELRVPLISAAMDTVTESPMAAAMARLGGLGFVHKNMSIEAQARAVARVKKSESGMIVDPVIIAPDQTLAEARALMHQHQISGIPVVEGTDRLVGILTHRDIRFAVDGTQKVRQLMTQEVVTAGEGVGVEASKALLQQHRIEKLPVVDAEGRLRGLITIRDIENSARHPQASKDARGRLRVGAAVGVGADRQARLQALVAAGVDVVALDTAHGHSRAVIEAVRATRREHPQLPVVAGNVATAAATVALCEAGADAIKVGIGPGSICTTRLVAGVGVPQLSAVLACAEAATPFGVGVIADGGIRSSGDVVKALAAGAHVVMVGSLFAGTDEAPGEVVLCQGRSFKSYRGMGSLGAMQDGSADRYFQDQPQAQQPLKLVPEGVEGLVAYRGPLTSSVDTLVGGLRSGMGYLGAADLDTLRAHATFVRISTAGMLESRVHDVQVTNDSPHGPQQAGGL